MTRTRCVLRSSRVEAERRIHEVSVDIQYLGRWIRSRSGAVREEASRSSLAKKHTTRHNRLCQSPGFHFIQALQSLRAWSGDLEPRVIIHCYPRRVPASLHPSLVGGWISSWTWIQGPYAHSGEGLTFCMHNRSDTRSLQLRT